MAKAFLEEEKELIKEQIIDVGRRLFCSYGFRRTSVQDIADQVGIAKGTFYSFFESKEVLFFYLFDEYEKNLYNRILKALEQSDDKKAALKKALVEEINAAYDNSLFRTVLDSRFFEQKWRKLPIAYQEKHLANDVFLSEHILHIIRNLDISDSYENVVVAGALRAIFIMTLHKKTIGETVFNDVLTLMIDLVVDRLFEGKNISA